MTKMEEFFRKEIDTRVGLESRLAVAEAQLSTHTGASGKESIEDSAVVAALRVQVACLPEPYHRLEVDLKSPRETSRKVQSEATQQRVALENLQYGVDKNVLDDKWREGRPEALPKVTESYLKLPKVTQS